jgi:hypothetical protein
MDFSWREGALKQLVEWKWRSFHIARFLRDKFFVKVFNRFVEKYVETASR